VRLPSKPKVTTGQVNGLRSFMDKTDDKKEYRRAVAVLQKADGKTYDYIAREQRVHIRTIKKWIGDYIQNGIEGLKTSKNYGESPGLQTRTERLSFQCYSTILTSLGILEIHGVYDHWQDVLQMSLAFQ
jgi:hypothetical protein